MEAHYISAEILDWNFSLYKTKLRKKHKFNQPYELLEHAETLLQFDDANFDHVKCFDKIQSAIQQRADMIYKKYFIEALHYDGKPDGYFNVLQDCGFIKPRMNEKLAQLISQKEQHNVSLLSKEQYGELLETVWYFLKSTDGFLYHKIDNIILRPNASQNISDKYWLELEIKHSIQDISFRGWVPKNFLSNESTENSLNLSRATFESGDKWSKADPGGHKNKTKDDVLIYAHLLLNDERRKAFLQKCIKHQ